MRFFSLILFLLLSLNGVVGFAQQSQKTFGKNRVQHHDFEWKFISTKNFYVYYYLGGTELAHNTARYAEEDFGRITDLLGYVPYAKTTIILYNSKSDMQQSNIGLQNKNYVGGETDLLKSKIEIAFEGSQVELQRQVSYKISEMLVNLMMYGGSLKDMVQNSYLMHVPDWFTKGAASYIAYGWEPEMNDYVKDLVLKQGKEPSRLVGEEAIIVGQSMWNFIADRYGPENVSNILNLCRIVRNAQMSVSSSLGVPYDQFLEEWKVYYREKLLIEGGLREFSDKDLRLRRFNKRGYRYNSIAFSPDSALMAYTENRNGRYQVVVYDFAKDKKKVVYRREHRRPEGEADLKIPLVAWASNNELGIIATKKGKPYYILKNLKTGKKEKKEFVTFDDILAFDFNGKAGRDRMMVLSATQNGWSDIYVYQPETNKAERLTKDLYDDFDPRYLPSGKLVFSSNRPADTLGFYGTYDEIVDQYDLFVYDLKAPNGKELERLTRTPYNERYPTPLDDKSIVFLADRLHNRQVYKLEFGGQKAEQITNFHQNVRRVGVTSSGQFAYVLRKDGRQFIFCEEQFNFEKTYGSYPLTFVEETQKQKGIDEKSKEEALQELEGLDLGLFRFESDTARKISPADSAAMAKAQQEKKLKISMPRDYQGMFGIDYVVSSLLVDQLRGVGVLFESRMSDMFGNHTLSPTVFMLTDLRSSSFQMEYWYLKRRNDFAVRYDRYNVFAFEDVSVKNYVRTTVEVEASKPLSDVARVSLIPNLQLGRAAELHPQLSQQVVKQNYFGLRGEFVYDNTLEHGRNMLEGTRIRLMAQQNFASSQESFGRFDVDIRRYQRIYKEMVLAVRGSYGQFFGPSPKNFLLGGMDNWLFANTNYEGENNPLNTNNEVAVSNLDLIYNQYVTNLRGFRYNERWGTKYLLFNAEVRAPVARLLYRGPIKSTFFRNLQLVGFYDIGSVWDGVNPFNQENSFNTSVESEPGFEYKVVNYRNPFLSSYGVGFRSMILGYYIKLDAAWGIEDYVVNKPRLHFTFGYDF